MRNKLYIFLSTLTVIFLFTISAICTECGASVDEAIEELGGYGDEEPPSEELSGTEPVREQPSGTEPGENSAGDEIPEEPPEENHPPIIETIIVYDTVVEERDEVGVIGGEAIFTIKASDIDGDELTYTNDCNGGSVSKIKIIDGSVKFGWRSLDIKGLYEIIIKVSDGKGGIAERTVILKENIDVIGKFQIDRNINLEFEYE